MFRETFKSAFDGGSQLTGLQTLAIQDFEKFTSAKCADAIYDMALRNHWLKWMIQEDESSWKAILAIGAFTIPKAMMVTAELRHRSAVKRAAAQGNQGGGTPSSSAAGSGGASGGIDGFPVENKSETRH